jgi:hypothetical protein
MAFLRTMLRARTAGEAHTASESSGHLLSRHESTQPREELLQHSEEGEPWVKKELTAGSPLILPSLHGPLHGRNLPMSG